MATIRNKLDQRQLVNLESGKNINLFAKGTADVSERDLSSLHLQNLVAKGHIIVIPEKGAGKRKEVNTSSAYPKGEEEKEKYIPYIQEQKKEGKK